MNPPQTAIDQATRLIQVRDVEHLLPKPPGYRQLSIDFTTIASRGLGPMFQRLPAELILEIFKLIVLAQNFAVQGGTVIKKAAFDKMSFLGMNNLCKVSKFFNMMIMQTMYSSDNMFAFEYPDIYQSSTRFANYMAPPIPRSCYRHFLRRIQVSVVLEDSSLLIPRSTGRANAVKRNSRIPIDSVAMLMDRCPGARTLRNLTDAATGFTDLKNLELTIETRIWYSPETALQMWKEAGFAVRAEQVKVLVTSSHQVCEGWERAVDQVIARI